MVPAAGLGAGFAARSERAHYLRSDAFKPSRSFEKGLVVKIGCVFPTKRRCLTPKGYPPLARKFTFLSAPTAAMGSRGRVSWGMRFERAGIGQFGGENRRFGAINGTFQVFDFGISAENKELIGFVSHPALPHRRLSVSRGPLGARTEWE